MNTILTVFKKEIIDTLRDKRTIMTAIVMPAVLIPVLMYGMTVVTKMIMEKEENKKLKISLIDPPEAFLSYIDTTKMEIKSGFDVKSGKEAIKSDSLDAMIRFTSNFLEMQEKMSSPRVVLFFKKTNLSVESRMKKMVEKYSDDLLDDRIESLGISSATIKPINLKTENVEEPQELVGQTVGGFLPYMFIMFCFMGCMYPALDLITGEKERGTIETLLTVPASRFKILLGKVMTISIVGLAATIMGIVGMYIGVLVLPDLPQEISTVLNSVISPKFVIMLLAMLLPLCVFFAGLISALVVKAKSFKEAQTYVSAVIFIPTLPLLVTTVVGADPSTALMWIPSLSQSMLVSEIISAGQIPPLWLAISVLSTGTLAALVYLLAIRLYRSERLLV